MSAEMKPCRLCGVKQSGVDEHNNEYEKLSTLFFVLEMKGNCLS